MARVWAFRSRLLPRGPLDALRQWLLFAAAYYIYRIVRGAVDGEAGPAFDHARTLVDAERSLGLFFEPGLQAWAITHQPWLVSMADWMYVNSHFVVTQAFLYWLYLARNEAFYYVRNMFMIAMGLALVGYVVFPTAPPRFLPEWGFTDTVAVAVGHGAANAANALYNPFAAVPSMHVAFALMVGLSAAKLVRHRTLRVAWRLYPLLITFVVVVTANHFWLDAALGAAVAALSALAAQAALARLRPDAWSFRRELGAEAPA